MDKTFNVLVLGGGGREHALVHALSRSPLVDRVHCAPGNPGIMELATTHHVSAGDIGPIIDICKGQDIELVVVGPEGPLVAGFADELRAAGIAVFGPGADGARLEGSKAFAKAFMKRHGIPTADFAICTTAAECEAAIDARKAPYVIKADGLAGGKGVFLTDDRYDAIKICRELLESRILGDAGKTVVIEDFLPGRELTVFALTDGTSFRLLAPSRDHKRVYEGDEGPNTGGMGAYAPVNLPDGVMERVVREVLEPTLKGLREDGIDYRGVLYIGLMLRDEGEAVPSVSVVEYNARFGDPETQAVLPLLRSDFGQLAKACAEGTLDACPEAASQGAALCVVLASGGYPKDIYRRDLPISGLEKADQADKEYPGSFVFHAGTRRTHRNEIVTDGGRVLSVVGVGKTFAEARENAYARVDTISFPDMHYRRDIGWSEQ